MTLPTPEIPLWLIALFFAFLIVPPILSCIGIYFLVTRKVSKVSLIVSGLILLLILSFVTWTVSINMPVNTPGGFWSIYLITLGFPINVYITALLGPTLSLTSEAMRALIGIALNYLAILSVVNVVWRIFSKRVR